MRLIITTLFLLPLVGVAEEQIHRVEPGQASPVGGWVYPFETHTRITADLAAVDLIIPELMKRAEDSETLLTDSEGELLEAIDAQATLAADLIAVKAQHERHPRALALWAVLGGVAAAVPIATKDLTGLDTPSALGASALSLAATASLAWLLGG